MKWPLGISSKLSKENNLKQMNKPTKLKNRQKKVS